MARSATLMKNLNNIEYYKVHVFCSSAAEHRSERDWPRQQFCQTSFSLSLYLSLSAYRGAALRSTECEGKNLSDTDSLAGRGHLSLGKVLCLLHSGRAGSLKVERRRPASFSLYLYLTRRRQRCQLSAQRGRERERETEGFHRRSSG